MIIEGLLELIFSLPFFGSFEMSGDVMSYARSMASMVVQVNQIINLSALVGTFFYALGLFIVCAIVRVILDII